MLVEIKDVQVGDEILISRFSELKYLRVLKAPKDSGKKDYYGNIIYTAAKCSYRIEEDYSTGYKRTKRMCTPNDHNKTSYEYLQGRDIWVVNR